MNEQTNEHIYTTHGAVVCCDTETAKLIWEMSLEDVSQMRAENTRLLSLVEGQAQTITQLREALNESNDELRSLIGCGLGATFDMIIKQKVKKNIVALLASTAPSKDGQG